MSNALAFSGVLGVAYEIQTGLKVGLEYSLSYLGSHEIKIPGNKGEFKLIKAEKDAKEIVIKALDKASITLLKHNLAVRLSWSL